MVKSNASGRAVSSPTFELHTLGWRAFQDLSIAVLREVWGQSVQSFADTRDGGRDGAFYGTWDSVKSRELPDAPFVVQCKFLARRDRTLSLSAIEEELEKIPNLVRRGVCSSYVLLTNARVTGDSELEIREAIAGQGVSHPLVLGGHWLNQTIAFSQRLRMFVPRVYGLGDLSQILDERAYAQGRALLDYLQEDLSTFVVTDAYQRAAKAITDHGLCILLGEPAVGKSVIAATLAMTALDQWESLTIRADGPDDVIRHWNPHESNQFFWIDDAFGAVRHERSLTDSWARKLPKVMAAVKGGAKVVLTSRDYIYREARPLLKEYSHPLLLENKIVIDVAELSLEERQQIVYNHVRLGDQPKHFRASIKRHLSNFAEQVPFRPEVARRLGRQAFTRNLPATEASITQFMAEPHGFLQDIFEGLGPDLIGALAVVYQAGELRAPVDVSNSEFSDLLTLLGSSPSDLNRALSTLKDTFLRCAPPPGSLDHHHAAWTFRHPTIREGFATYLAKDPNLLKTYISGLDDFGIFGQLDCGSVDIKGTLIAVPSQLFELVAARISRARQHNRSWEFNNRLNYFLARRTSRAFLRVYLQFDPKLADRCCERIHSYLSAGTEIDVLGQLHTVHLLPESNRLLAVRRISDVAVETPDADWFGMAAAAELLTDQERSSILDRIRDELIPSIGDMLWNWEFNEQGDSADDYYYPLEETLQRYIQALDGDLDSCRRLRDALRRVEQRKTESSYWDDEEDNPASQGEPSSLQVDKPAYASGPRSIFDDVDE